MKNGIILFCMAVIFISAFNGCSQRVGDFTLISTKNVEIGGKYKQIEGRFTGEDSRGEILLTPLGAPNLKTAVDKCIEAGKGELITNAVIDFSYWTAIVYGERKYTVTGDIWVRATIADLINNSGHLYVLNAGPSGYQLESISDPSKTIRVDNFVIR